MLTRVQTISLKRIVSPSWLEISCLLAGKRPLLGPLLASGCSVLMQQGPAGGPDSLLQFSDHLLNVEHSLRAGCHVHGAMRTQTGARRLQHRCGNTHTR